MNPLLLVLVLLYLAGTMLIGYLASRRVKNATDFVLAGRRMPLMVSASVMFATWYGSETVLGASSTFAKEGILGVIDDPFGTTLGLILIGLFFARPLYRMNILTFCDYFRIRFDKKAELLSAVLIIPSYFGWIAAQMLAIGVVLHALFGLPVAYGTVLGAMMTIFYTYLGGMMAISVTDVLQTVVITAGTLVATAVLLGKSGGIVALADHTPENFFSFVPEAGIEPALAYIAAWMAIGLGAIPQQEVFQRVMSSKNERTAVRASYLSGGMYLIIGSIPLLIGLCARVMEPSMLELEESAREAVLPRMILQHTALPVQALFFGALISAIMSTVSGATLAPATVFAGNLVRNFRPDLTDKAFLRVLRLSVLGIALLSLGMAFLGKGIYELVREASEMSLVSLFVPLTAGLYWKKASAAGALSSMLAGTAVWLWVDFFDIRMLNTDVPSSICGLCASILAMLAGSWIAPAKNSATPVAEP